MEPWVLAIIKKAWLETTHLAWDFIKSNIGLYIVTYMIFEVPYYKYSIMGPKALF